MGNGVELYTEVNSSLAKYKIVSSWQPQTFVALWHICFKVNFNCLKYFCRWQIDWQNLQIIFICVGCLVCKNWTHAHSLCRSMRLQTNSISDIWITSDMWAICLHTNLGSRRYQTFTVLTRPLTQALSPKTWVAIWEVWQESVILANNSKKSHFSLTFLWFWKCLHKRWDLLCTFWCAHEQWPTWETPEGS